MWWIGDWANYAEEHFGEEALKDFTKGTGLDWKTVKEAQHVCKRIPMTSTQEERLRKESDQNKIKITLHQLLSLLSKRNRQRKKAKVLESIIHDLMGELDWDFDTSVKEAKGLLGNAKNTLKDMKQHRADLVKNGKLDDLIKHAEKNNTIDEDMLYFLKTDKWPESMQPMADDILGWPET
jgi:hypothetical protein